MAREENFNSMRRWVIIVGIIMIMMMNIMMIEGGCGGCSGNGVCVGDDCTCYDGYGGDDCSLRMRSIKGGQTIESELQSREWEYYQTTAKTGDFAFTYIVTQENVDADCDLYIAANYIPGRIFYDEKDSSENANYSISFSTHAGTTYYAGVYGYHHCIYTISLDVTVHGCGSGCGKYGTCEGTKCYCDIQHTGSDCSIKVKELTVDEDMYTGVLGGDSQWDYYYYQPMTSPLGGDNGYLYQAFQIVLTLNYEPSDDDYYEDDYYDDDNYDYYNGNFKRSEEDNVAHILYVRADKVPTETAYDSRNGIPLDNLIPITVQSPSSPLYYFAVYTTATSLSYSLSLSPWMEGECAGDCSGHGICIWDPTIIAALCYCYDGYAGDICERYEEDMDEGVEYEGLVTDVTWNYFQFEGTSLSNVKVTVTPEEGSVDCAMLIQSMYYPHPNDYEYRAASTSSDPFSITVLNPMGKTWYIGIGSSHLCNYSISKSIDSSGCPNECSGRGVCNEGRCECDEYYVGESCAFQIFEVENPHTMQGTITTTKWIYYHVRVPDGVTSLSVSILEDDNHGFLSLYLNGGAIPTLTSFYTYSSGPSNVKNVYYVVNKGETRDYYIGVYATSLLPLSQAVVFKIGFYSPHITFP